MPQVQFIHEGNTVAIRNIVRTMVPSWQDRTDDQLVLESVSGGITNILYSVTDAAYTPESPAPRKVLVRIYGENTERIIDREKEYQTFLELHKVGIAPRFFGRFSNGFVYEWMDGTVMTPPDLLRPEIQVLIARCLAGVHVHMQAPATSQTENAATIMKRWLRQIRDTEVIGGQLTLKDLENEVNFLVEKLPLLGSPIVLCHNDLLAGNVVLRPSGDRVVLLDYEYMNPGFRGYDLGNHFAEWMGFEMIESRFPNLDQKRPFLKAYLETFATLSGGSAASVTEADIVRLNTEVDVFASVSRLFWGIWAVIQSYSSTIDFDYKSYSNTLVSYYFSHKPFIMSTLQKFAQAS